jgi:hypothetical protein
VLRQAALVARAVVAVLADKRLLPIVQPQVPRQVALLGGLIPTVLALVDHHVVAAACRGVAFVERVSDFHPQATEASFRSWVLLDWKSQGRLVQPNQIL